MASTTSQAGTITSREAEQVDRANASGKTLVVFIHGPWLLPGGWDRWAEVFEEAGYAAVTPADVVSTARRVTCSIDGIPVAALRTTRCGTPSIPIDPSR